MRSFRRILSAVLVVSFFSQLLPSWQAFALASSVQRNAFEPTVAVLVLEDMYSGDLKNAIQTYADDISQSQKGVDVMIIPTSKSFSSSQIYSVLENLYFTKHLQGVVFVGDLPLVELSDGMIKIPSVFPYTDFVDPAFFWDEASASWIQNYKNTEFQAEIWHGVIPGSSEQIISFFQKNHATHVGLQEKTLPLQDEMLMVSSADERASVALPLLGQYETKQDIQEELKNYRYDTPLASAVYGSFFSSSIFSPLSPSEKLLFPAGEKNIFDTIAETKTVFSEEGWNSSSDLYIKDTLAKILPKYAEIVQGHQTDLQKFVTNTGRWNPESADTIPEMISLLDEYVSANIASLNDAAKTKNANVLSQLDAGVYMVPSARIDTVVNTGESIYTEYTDITGYLNGKKIAEITAPEQCSLYRGSRFYEDQYSSISYLDWKNNKKQSLFSNDVAVLTHNDSLKNVVSQEVEYSTLYDTTALLSGKTPIEQCENLGGCCAINFENPSACNPDKAISPVFSWNGGKKIQKEDDVRVKTSLPLSETSALVCQRFNFNEESGSSSYVGFSAPRRDVDTVFGPLNPQKIPSLMVHDNPSTTGEQSLKNALSSSVSSALAVNRVPYIDLLTSDAGQKQYVRQIVPDFSRYQYKPNSSDLYTVYELSRLAFENDLKLVGGNTVYNRTSQPKDSAGIATGSVALKFQRVLQFKDGKVFSSDVRALPDDMGKTPYDWEIETLKAVQQKITELGGLENYKKALFDAMKSYNLEMRSKNNPAMKTLVSSEIEAEVNAYLETSWEWKVAKLITENPTIISEAESKKDAPLNILQYYLHDALSGYSVLDASLNSFLPSVSSSEMSGIYWQNIPLAQGYDISWLSDEQKKLLPKDPGSMMVETFEVLAVGDNPFVSFVPVGGRSFLNIRPNAPSKTDFYAEATGNTLRNHTIQTKKVSDISSVFGACGGGESGEMPVPVAITQDMFYTENIIDKDTCQTSYFVELHNPYGTSFPDAKEITQNIFNLYTIPELAFLFRWKDMTAAEKHAEIQKLLLDADDKSITVETKKPYAYAHLQVEGDDGVVWKGPDGDSNILTIDWSKDPQAEAQSKLSSSDTDNNNDEKCGPMEGVPIQEWIPAVQCWLKELQKTGIATMQKCSLDESAWNNLFSGDYNANPDHIRISAKTHPLLPDTENALLIEFLSTENKRVMGKDIRFTVDLQGAKASSVVPDQDDATAGLQLSVVDGQEGIEIIPTEDTITVTVTASWKDWTKTETAIFSRATGARLAFVEKSKSFQNGVMLYTMEVVAKDNNTDFQSFDHQMYLSSVPSEEVVFSTPVVSLGDTFTVAVRSDTPKELLASVRGIPKATYTLQPDPTVQTSIADVVLAPVSEYIDFHTTTDIPLIAVNALGNPVLFSDVPTVISPESGGNVTLLSMPSSPSGYGVRIRTENEMGSLAFVVQYAGGEKTLSLKTGAKNTKEEYSSYNMNALYASFLGIDNYGDSLSDHLATDILYGSSTLNAITTFVTPPKTTKNHAIIESSGKVSTMSSRIVPNIQSYSPLTIGLFDAQLKRYTASFRYIPSATSVVLSAPLQEVSGIFVENKDSAGKVTISSAFGQTEIKVSDSPVAKILSNGNLELLDASYAFSIVDSPNESGLELSLSSGSQKEIAHITFRGGTWQNVWNSPFVEQENGDYIVPSSSLYRPLEIFQNEVSLQALGTGFAGSEKYVLQYASGASVGDAVQSSADVFLITLGDPTIALSKTESNISGFDQTVGKEIFTSKNGSIKKTFLANIDGGSEQELVNWMTDGRLEVLQKNNNTLSSVGTVALIPHAKNVFVHHSSDGFDDILALSEKGEWILYDNTNTVFTEKLHPEGFPSSSSFVSASLLDIDADGFDDIVGVTTTGKLSVWYGPDYSISPVEIDSFDTPKAGERFTNIQITAWNGNDDTIADILLKDSKRGTVRYISSSPRTYQKTIYTRSQASDLPEFMKNLEDANKNGVPDMYETLSENGLPAFVNDVLKLSSADIDNDGIPDGWDENDTGMSDTDMAGLEQSLDQIIDFFASCHGGSCLAMPINYAFFAPGQTNGISSFLNVQKTDGVDPLTDAITGVVSEISSEVSSIIDKIGLPTGLQPYVMTVFNMGPTSVCMWSSCVQFTPSGPRPISFQEGFARSTFRFYLSPTLTGGLGLGVCTGTGGATAAPLGKCFIQAVPQDWLSKYCEDKNPESKDGENASRSSGGEVMFQVESSYAGEDSAQLMQFGLSEIDTDIPSSSNTRVEGGPGWIARWKDRQIEEFSALFTMPALTVYYPDMTGNFYNASALDEAKQRMQDHISGKPFEEEWNGFTEAQKAREKQQKEASSSPSRNALAKGFESASDVLNDLKYRAETVNDFYRAIESVPLLQLSRNVLTLKMPALSSTELNTKMAQIDDWLDKADAEIEAFQKDTSGWTDEQKQDIEQQYTQIIKKVKKLRTALDFYKDEAPRLMADLDSEVSKYLYSIICYIDAITELSGRWLVKNKLRYMKWVELFETLPEIMKAFQTLPKIFNGYQSYCETCRAGNYDSSSFVVNIMGKFLPEIPVIKFPRLPDITLDISQINAAIVVKVPEIVIKPIDIRFPTIPNLALPRTPDINYKLNFPDIPELPTFEIPKLPDFPGIPLPKLPDLPPPPLLPSFMADFGSISKVIEKGLYLYCLIIRKGIFIYPEMTAMSTVETLTARSLQPLSMDFLSKSYPDIQVPYVSEIKVTSEVNLEQNLDILSKPLEEFIKELNKKVTWFLNSLNPELDANFDFLNQSDALDSVNKNIQDAVDSLTNPINDAAQEIENSLEETATEIQENLDETTEQLEEDLSKKIIPLLHSDIANLSESFASDSMISVSELREQMGLDPVMVSSSSSVSQSYTALKKEVLHLKSFYDERYNQILASASPVFDDVPASSLVHAQTQMPTTVANAETLVPSLQQTLPQTYSAQSGIYLQTPQKQVVRLSSYTDETSNVHSLFFWNEDIVYATDFGVFLKERNSDESSAKGSVQTVSADDLLPSIASPKQFEIDGKAKEIEVAVYPEPLSSVTGLWTIARHSIFDSFTHSYPTHYVLRANKTLYTELSQTYTPKTNYPISFATTIAGMPIDAGNIFRLEPLDFSTEVSGLNPQQFYEFRSYWVYADGTLGTVSEPKTWKYIPSPETSVVAIDGTSRQGYMYKPNTFSVSSSFVDVSGDSFEYAWDADRNGTYELQAENYISPSYRQPTKENIPVQITTSHGETSVANATFSYIPPDITLESVSPSSVQGVITPSYAGVPITLLRERFGKTSSLGDIQNTQENGTYAFENLNTSLDAFVTNNAGDTVGIVSADTGVLKPVMDGYSVEIASGTDDMPMRQVLLNADKKVVANVVVQVPGSKRVSFALSSEQGVYVQDPVLNDEVSIALLPDNAPENNGGMVVFDDQKPLAMIYPDGNIRFFSSQDGLSLYRPQQNQLEIQMMRFGKAIATVFIIPNTKNIQITPNVHSASYSAKNTFSPSGSGLFSFFFPSAFAETVSKFSDVQEGSPLAKALGDLLSSGRIAGFADGTFHPDDPITRAQFVRDALSLTHCLDCLNPSDAEKKSVDTTNVFPDIENSHWANFCIAKAKQLGMVEGYGDGLFRTESRITNAEAVAVLLREAGIALSSLDLSFADVSPTAWYYPYMVTAVEKNLIEPVFGFAFPEATITRGDFALMAAKLFSLQNCTEKDSDKDTIPDAVEEYNGYNPKDPSDGTLQSADAKKPWDEVLYPFPLEALSQNSTNNGNNTMSSSNNSFGNNNGNNTEDNSLDNNGKDEGDSKNENGDTSSQNGGVNNNTNITNNNNGPICTNIPEDRDGIDDDDGCPELYSKAKLPPASSSGVPFSVFPTFSSSPSSPFASSSGSESIWFFSGDPAWCGELDYFADIRIGDTIWTAIVKDDNSLIFKQSKKTSL